MGWILPIAGILGALGVALGAIGTHALHLGPQGMMRFETALQYHLWHTLTLVALAILIRLNPSIRAFKITAVFFVIGIVFFSGSLYGAAITGLRDFTVFAPVGGSMMILGWLILAVGGVQAARSHKGY